MAGRRRSGGWRSETVLAAIVTGAAAVVVAVVGLFGGFGGGADGDDPTASPRPEPRISISETSFTVRGVGSVVIRVAGITDAFRSGDRLYAIARPPAVKTWWVSDPVTPLLGGDWVALIEASPRNGEQLTVSAVRIPAEEGDDGGTGAAPGTVGGTPTRPDPSPTAAPTSPTGASTSSTAASTSPTAAATPTRSRTQPAPTRSPDDTSRRAAIEQELRARGADASHVEGVSDPVTVVVPSA